MFDNLKNIAGQFMQNYSSNNQDPNQFSHTQTLNDYQQYAQQASPDELYKAHEQSYQQMPQESRQNIFSSIMGALQNKGIDPQQIGIQNSDPSPQNLAKATQYVSQKPDLVQSIFGKGGVLGSPLSKMALIGALAFAAGKFKTH